MVKLLSIITVTYHSESVMPEFINSLQEIDVPFQLLVHDNTDRNIGLSKAVNRLIAEADGDLILLCNPDVKFDKTFSYLLDYVDAHPLTGAVPEFYNEDGTRQRVINRRFPTVPRILLDFTAFGRNYLSRLFPFIRRDYTYANRNFNGPERIEQPGGSCLLLSKQAVVIMTRNGELYDEQFPVLWNDVDFALRARNNGLQFAIVPSTRVVHVLGHSVQKADPSFLAMLFFSHAGLMGFAEKWRLRGWTIQLALFGDIIFLVGLKLMKRVLVPRRPLESGGVQKAMNQVTLKFRSSLQ